MSENLFIGKASLQDYDAYIDFENYVFGMNGTTNTFYHLLPKLFRPEDFDIDATYVVKENDEFRASIGAYPMTLKVSDDKLKVVGIGNVAVHPRARSKGYMKKLMNLSLEDMIKAGADLAVLSGQRNRYQYFSYEKGGQEYTFTVTKTNLRHRLADISLDNVEFRFLKKEDTALIEECKALHEADSMHTERTYFYETLCSWEAKPYVVLKDNHMIGYLTVQKDNFVAEIYAKNAEAYKTLLVAAQTVLNQEKLTYIAMPHQVELIRSLSLSCESVTSSDASNYSILNYQHVTQSLLKLKSSYTTLADGEVTILVRGVGRDENITITVKNNVPTVEHTDKTPIMTLEHLEAVSFFVGAIDTNRLGASSVCQNWFPLPLSYATSDRV